jgi:hypothetical protein
MHLLMARFHVKHVNAVVGPIPQVYLDAMNVMLVVTQMNLHPFHVNHVTLAKPFQQLVALH